MTVVLDLFNTAVEPDALVSNNVSQISKVS